MKIFGKKFEKRAVPERGTERKESRDGVSRDILRIRSRIEGLSVESDQERFVGRDVYAALGDVRVCLGDGDVAAARTILKRLVEEYGERPFGLGRMLGRVKGEDAVTGSSEVSDDQREWYAGAYRASGESIGETGRIVSVGKLLKKITNRHIVPILMVGMLFGSDARAESGESAGAPERMTFEETLSVFRGMRLEDCFSAPGWHDLDVGMQVMVLEESMRSGEFDTWRAASGLLLFFNENPFHSLVRNFADRVAREHPSIILLMSGRSLDLTFRDRNMAVRLLRAAVQNASEDVIAEYVSSDDIDYYSEFAHELSGAFRERMPGLFLVHDVHDILGSNQERSFRGLVRDPAWSLFRGMSRDWVPAEDTRGFDDAKLTEHGLMIARNLYFRGVSEVTREAVAEESGRIAEAREKVRDIPLFAGRNVVMIAGNEENFSSSSSDKYRFGTDRTVEAVRQQQGTGGFFERFRAIRRVRRFELVRVVKVNALSRIAETAGPLTILLEGHGTESGFYLSGTITTSWGMSDEWNRITPEDFARALNRRHQLILREIEKGDMSAEDQQPVIISYLSCYNSNQARSLYEHLDPGVPRPIVIGGSEFGQVMYNDSESEYNSYFLEGHILQLNREGSATVGGAVEESLHEDPLYIRSNPSIYIPDPDDPGRPMQIAEERMAVSDSSSV